MVITDLFDELVKKRQDTCDHNYQYRVATINKTFCGTCGLEES